MKARKTIQKVRNQIIVFMFLYLDKHANIIHAYAWYLLLFLSLKKDKN